MTPLRLRFSGALILAALAISRAATATPPSVNVHVQGADGVAIPDGWPLTVGVPYAKDASVGAGNVGTAFAFQAGGAGAPADVDLRATWQDGGNAQWVGVDFQFAAGEDNYTLVAGTGTAAHPDPVTVTTGASEHTVSTTDLVAVVPLSGGPLLQSVSIGGHTVISQGTNAVQWLEIADGSRYEAVVAAVTVEKAGGLHSILRAEGDYVKVGAADVGGHFVTRLHFYAGQRMIGIQHTYIWDADPDLFKLAELAVDFRTAMPTGRAGTARHDGTDDRVTVVMNPGEALSVYQRDHFHWALDPDTSQQPAYRLDHDQPLSPVFTPDPDDKAGSWIGVQDGTVTTALVLRDLWEQFPKRLQAEEDRITAYLWSSRSGNPAVDAGYLDLTLAGIEAFAGGVNRATDDATLADGPFFWTMKNWESKTKLWTKYKSTYVADTSGDAIDPTRHGQDPRSSSRVRTGCEPMERRDPEGDCLR